MSRVSVIRCSHREELRHAVERACDGRRPLEIRGGGRRGCRRAETVLTAPAGILDLWEKDLVARVGAGTSVEDLDRQLESSGLESGLVVPRPDRATLGGIFASGEGSRVGGATRALRELALGALIVDGRGRPVECGARVVKNVAGYDTLRLHHGAGGGLGILADLVLRLRARPEARAARFLEASWEELRERLPRWRLEAGSDAEGELILDAEAARRCGLGESPGVCFVAEGRTAVLRAWEERLGGNPVGDRLPALRDLGWSENAEAGLVLRAVTPTSRLLARGRAVTAALSTPGRRAALVHDARTSVAQVLVFGPPLGDEREPIRSVLEDLGPAAVDRGRVDPSLPSSHPRERWLRRLREACDPADILPPIRRRHEVGS